jgi:hypothetical protein
MRLHIQIPSPDSISGLSREIPSPDSSRFQSRRARIGRARGTVVPQPSTLPALAAAPAAAYAPPLAGAAPAPSTPSHEPLSCRPMRDETLSCRPMRDETLPCSMLRLHRGDHRRRMQCPDQVSRVPGARHPPRHASAHHDARTPHSYRVPGARHTCDAQSPTPIPPSSPPYPIHTPTNSHP